MSYIKNAIVMLLTSFYKHNFSRNWLKMKQLAIHMADSRVFFIIQKMGIDMIYVLFSDYFKLKVSVYLTFDLTKKGHYSVDTFGRCFNALTFGRWNNVVCRLGSYLDNVRNISYFGPR